MTYFCPNKSFYFIKMYDIKANDNFVLRFEQTFKECWDAPALSDYRCSTLTYGQLAKNIETNILLWRAAGLKSGDKIAINARSSAAWAISSSSMRSFPI